MNRFAIAFALAALCYGRVASSAPYTKLAPPMDHYITTLGFKAPTDPTADLSACMYDACKKQGHEQLELYLLEGAETGEKTGDPVLLAWFAIADTAGIAPWHLTNCGDYNYDIDYDCDVAPWGPNIWQVGLGTQVSYNYDTVAAAFAYAYPNRTAESVGNEVLTLAAQTKKFPANMTVEELVAAKSSVTDGMHNTYWIATLERDMKIGAYTESGPATAWPCYKSGYPSWCSWYRQASQWQSYSDTLSQVINSWNAILDQWSKNIVDDVIVDDVSADFSISGSVKADGKGGWRGHFTWAAAASTPTVTGTWTAKLPMAGDYSVSAFVPYSSNATANDAKIVVHATDGDQAVSFDQSVTGGHFEKLGTFHFGTTAVATMTNQATAPSSVGWDALRFHLEKADVTPEPAADGGVEPADAGPISDARSDIGSASDAHASDAASSSHESDDSGGCGCRAAGSREAADPWIFLVTLATAFGRRSRNRRRPNLPALQFDPAHA